METFNQLLARDAAARITAGDLTSEDLVQSCLARIAAREPDVLAWVHLDPEQALAQARACDQALAAGESVGPLHGVPVGLKDIIDTADMPTENGSDLFAGRMAEADATVVRLLRDAGAVIMGKTVTTEFALSGARATRNPHDPARTPGGSSSGSAAAVADAMIPLSLGSQTGGSMIRPASFCGVHGYKPTYGSISRAGAFILSRRLDHLGVYARSLADLALIGDVLMVHDAADFEMRYHAGCHLVDALAEPLEVAPRLAVFKGAPWAEIEDDTAAALESVFAQLGGVADMQVPSPVDEALAVHATIMDASAAANPGRYLPQSDKLLPETVKRISVGKDIAAADYVAAIDKAEVIRQALDGLFADVDALITPAAPGEAPLGLQSTGNPVFQKIWTLAGMPSVTLPVMSGPNGLPIGLQVIGRRGGDAALFRTAQWIEEKIK
jgi:Asp-tRNA(Asn)/Glu-tRNA(Gln) amidotransferase A subunit family amidase